VGADGRARRRAARRGGGKGRRKADRRRAKGRREKKPIDPTSAYLGALGTQGNARRLFNDAVLLHSAGRFQGAIPLAIMAIEECLKGIELGREFRKLRDIPADGQERLASHAHKLGHVHGWIVRHMEDERMKGVHAGLAREGKVPREGGGPVSLGEIADNARRTRDMVGGLQRVKEMCAYVGWDAKEGSWQSLDVDCDDAEALSSFVLAMAMTHYEMLHGSTEFAVNALVDRIPALEKCREEKVELDAPGLDPDKVQRGEGVLLGICGKAGARGPYEGGAAVG